MGKQRKQRQQPSKKKVQVKQKLAKQDPAGTAPAKKPVDAIAPEDANNICVYGLNNLGNTCFFNSALQASPHNMSSSALQQEYMHSVLPGTEGGPAKQAMCHMCHSLTSLARHVHVTGACTVQVLVSVPQLRDCCLQPMDTHPVKKGPIGAALQELVQSVYGARGCDSSSITEHVSNSHLLSGASINLPGLRHKWRHKERHAIPQAMEKMQDLTQSLCLTVFVV